jgi:hypothetical protein
MPARLKIAAAIAAISLLTFTSVQAAEGRYQAHWNGKEYLILDSDKGHMWTYRGTSMLYNGRIDGDEFEPPESPGIWQQNHGRWTKQK